MRGRAGCLAVPIRLLASDGATLNRRLAVAAGRACDEGNSPGAYLLVVPFDGSEPRAYPVGGGAFCARLDPSGRFVVLLVKTGRTDAVLNSSIRVIDLDTRESRVLDTKAAPGEPCGHLNGLAIPAWLPDGRLVTEGANGLRQWNIATGESRQLRPCTLAENGALVFSLLATPDGRSVLQ